MFKVLVSFNIKEAEDEWKQARRSTVMNMVLSQFDSDQEDIWGEFKDTQVEFLLLLSKGKKSLMITETDISLKKIA